MSADSTPPPQVIHRIVRKTLVIYVSAKALIHAGEIENVGRRMADLTQANEPMNVVIDLRAVRNVSSAFIGKLIALHRQMVEEEGRKFAVASVPPQIMSVIKLLKLHKRILFFKDESEAIDNFLS